VAQSIDTVAVPDFDIDLLGHSYYAEADPLLHDMHDLLRHNDDPSKRQRLTRESHDGLEVWRLLR